MLKNQKASDVDGFPLQPMAVSLSLSLSVASRASPKLPHGSNMFSVGSKRYVIRVSFVSKHINEYFDYLSIYLSIYQPTFCLEVFQHVILKVDMSRDTQPFSDTEAVR